MNKFNKGKFIGVVAASLSAVSLMGVGFATWVIGIRQTETNGNISITADTVEYKSLKIEAAFEGNLKLGETTPITNHEYFNTSKTVDGNLTVKVNFTFTLGKDFKSENFDFNKIKFEIVTDEVGFLNNKPAEEAVKLTQRPYTKNLTYFDAPAPVGVTYNELEKATEETTGSTGESTESITNKFKFSTNVSFTWGSMFGTLSPMNYYENEVKKVSDTDKATFVENAYLEMNAMQAKYNVEGTSIKLKMNLVNEVK